MVIFDPISILKFRFSATSPFLLDYDFPMKTAPRNSILFIGAIEAARGRYEIFQPHGSAGPNCRGNWINTGRKIDCSLHSLCQKPDYSFIYL